MELKEKSTRPSTECIRYLTALFPSGYFHLTQVSKNKLHVQVNKYKRKWTNLTARDKTVQRQDALLLVRIPWEKRHVRLHYRLRAEPIALIL